MPRSPLSREADAHYREPRRGPAASANRSSGTRALAAARLRPRQVPEPVFRPHERPNRSPAGISGIGNQADLAYRHLLHIKDAGGIRDEG